MAETTTISAQRNNAKQNVSRNLKFRIKSQKRQLKLACQPMGLEDWSFIYFKLGNGSETLFLVRLVWNYSLNQGFHASSVLWQIRDYLANFFICDAKSQRANANAPSGGSKGGARDVRPPWGSKFFQFHAFFGKILDPPLASTSYF